MVSEQPIYDSSAYPRAHSFRQVEIVFVLHDIVPIVVLGAGVRHGLGYFMSVFE